MSQVSAIPRLIHQMWIGPSEAARQPLPTDIQEHLYLWSALNSGHVHKLWSLREVLDLCAERDRLDVADTIGQCRFPSMQADIARLFLLGAFGGFWSDLKLRPRQPIPQALHGYETVLVEHFPKPELPYPGGLLVNGFLGAVPAAPLIGTALQLAIKNVRERQGRTAFLITGPGALTTAWRSFRLANPDRSRAVHVIPHADAWGVIWDVGQDSYNPPGMHWMERQQRESPFVNEQPAGPPSGRGVGLFEAVPGHVASIEVIHSKQGFHPFGPHAGFSWLADAPTPRIFFDAFLPFDRLRLKMYAVENYSLSMVEFRVNGRLTCSRIQAAGDGASIVDLGPFDLKAEWNELAISPPDLVPANRSAGSADRGSPRVAIASVLPWIGT